MNLSLWKTPTLVEITSGGGKILLDEISISLNDYIIDFPGEYERSLIFIEARQAESGLVYIITLEGRTAIYLPPSTTVADLEILRDVNNRDIVIMPANEHLWKTVETWEASVIVPYGTSTDEFLKKLWQIIESSLQATIKSSDFETEVTRFVALS